MRGSRTRKWVGIVMAIAVMALLASCSSTKHVPEGELLLDKVKINISDPHSEVESSQLFNYLRQNANHRVLGGLKLQLAFYNLSGKDSTKWYNRWIQRVGSPPVIYDSTLTLAGSEQLHTALTNRGFMNNQVTYRVDADSAKRKARVDYDVQLGEPYYIRSIGYDIPDAELSDIILADSADFNVHSGDLLNFNRLDEWRQGITENLRNHGYYAFNKEYITFTADTAAGSKAVDLTLVTRAPYRNDHMPYYTEHEPFYVRDVVYVTDYDPVAMHDGYRGVDTVMMSGGVQVYEGEERYLRLDILDECNHIEPGELYNAEAVNRTYRALGRLSTLKQINIDVRPVGEVDGVLMVDAFVLLQPEKPQTVSVSLEGTNSEGDLGFGVGLDYEHRNIFKGAEVFNAKAKVSYESISGNISGLINDNYSEYFTELGVTFPKFMFPFLKRSFKRKIQASTAFTVNFDYQARPDYTRIIVGGAWRYQWSERSRRMSHTLTLFDLSYISVPKINQDYYNRINKLLQQSYKPHLIMRMGYNFYRTNKAEMSVQQMGLFQRNVFTIRANAETAGNLLNALSHISGQKADESGSYKALGILYSQYVKAEADYALTHYFDRRQSVAFHVGAGIAIPYGNSDALPFEKRFYSGGANSVRGWGVRTLGPGSYNAKNDSTIIWSDNFIRQCGDIRFDLNLEYRAKLFWVVELGLFIDAGNIWTIKDYKKDQAGGVFKWDKFYEQIAVAYGAGIRLDFKYFLVRVDMGMKAHDPASGQEHWPLLHPEFKRDSEFHFSVGYPF